MSYVTRTNPAIRGMGCMWCGGAGDDFDSPAYGSGAVQSARDQAGIDYSAMGMPSQTQLMAASTNGAVQPLTAPQGPTSNTPYAISTGYPYSVQQTTGDDLAVLRPGTMANALTQTAPDYPTPTSLTVSQAFQGAVPGDAQPGYVPLPGLNWTANNLSFVQPPPNPGAACPVTSWANSNPWILIGAAFAVAYLASKGKQRRARA